LVLTVLEFSFEVVKFELIWLLGGLCGLCLCSRLFLDFLGFSLSFGFTLFGFLLCLGFCLWLYFCLRLSLGSLFSFIAVSAKINLKRILSTEEQITLILSKDRNGPDIREPSR